MLRMPAAEGMETHNFEETLACSSSRQKTDNSIPTNQVQFGQSATARGTHPHPFMPQSGDSANKGQQDGKANSSNSFTDDIDLVCFTLIFHQNFIYLKI